MRLFIFAIGGTGSRVLKSLLMLSAAGVRAVGADGKPLPDIELVPIIIDPHKSNADLKRTEQLLGAYRAIRRQLYGDQVNAEGFFATKISSLHDIMRGSQVALDDSFIFNLESMGSKKFRDYIGYDTMDAANQALTSLLFADYQLENKMSIGFVGSPNIGSVALNSIKDSNEFKAFTGAFAAGDRIFFISSIFGGTGAAGFPILVKNIRQASGSDMRNRAFLQQAPIGGLTMLPYFSLMASDDKNDHRIDNSDFIVKTQSALEYYKDTITGRMGDHVNAIYYLGDHGHNRPYEYDPGDKRDQKDPAHLVELVGAMAPLNFATIPQEQLVDPVTGTQLETKAFEYGLASDSDELNFASFGSETRSLIYRPLVKFHLLMLFLRTGFIEQIGKGYTQDEPRLERGFTATQFWRTLTEQFMGGYTDWLTELHDNRREVTFFVPGVWDMAMAINGVSTRKGLLGHKTVDCDTFKAEMNRLSRDSQLYKGRTPEFKLLDLFNRAASKIITERYNNIN